MSEEHSSRPADPSTTTLADADDLAGGSPPETSRELTNLQLWEAKIFLAFRCALFPLTLGGVAWMWSANYNLLSGEKFYLLFMHQPWSILLGIAMCVSPLALFIMLMFFVYRNSKTESSFVDIEQIVKLIISPINRLIDLFKSQK